MLNLDTHIVIFALLGELESAERKLLTKMKWSISPIVLWEITTLHARKRIELDLNDSGIIEIIKSIQLLNLNIDVCKRIKDLDFKSDPADEIIAATSLAYNIPLLTRDKRMLQSTVVPLA